ncbi:MAG: hypothetical protein CM1200mP11_4080 [Nitrosopumilaceae archaeon]|nr:MAG: hypothetical protein CM1200mP11_4080 [Nitrosopumilaceae archaeon]
MGRGKKKPHFSFSFYYFLLVDTDLVLCKNKRNVYIAQIGKNIMIPIVGTFLSILSTLTGQLGPNYDPLFYDVMIYIFGTIMFTIFLLGVISFWLRVHGWAYKDNRERWVDELDRHFEREGIGLIPDNGKYW